jgi:hypothetical protein
MRRAVTRMTPNFPDSGSLADSGRSNELGGGSVTIPNGLPRRRQLVATFRRSWPEYRQSPQVVPLLSDLLSEFDSGNHHACIFKGLESSMG